MLFMDTQKRKYKIVHGISEDSREVRLGEYGEVFLSYVSVLRDAIDT